MDALFNLRKQPFLYQMYACQRCKSCRLEFHTEWFTANDWEVTGTFDCSRTPNAHTITLALNHRLVTVFLSSEMVLAKQILDFITTMRSVIIVELRSRTVPRAIHLLFNHSFCILLDRNSILISEIFPGLMQNAGNKIHHCVSFSEPCIDSYFFKCHRFQRFCKYS